MMNTDALSEKKSRVNLREMSIRILSEKALIYKGEKYEIRHVFENVFFGLKQIHARDAENKYFDFFFSDNKLVAVTADDSFHE